jgi:hypothetical protein
MLGNSIDYYTRVFLRAHIKAKAKVKVPASNTEKLTYQEKVEILKLTLAIAANFDMGYLKE